MLRLMPGWSLVSHGTVPTCNYEHPLPLKCSCLQYTANLDHGGWQGLVRVYGRGDANKVAGKCRVCLALEAAFPGRTLRSALAWWRKAEVQCQVNLKSKQ